MKQQNCFSYRVRQLWSNIIVAGKVRAISKYIFDSYMINMNVISGISKGNDRETPAFLVTKEQFFLKKYEQ